MLKRFGLSLVASAVLLSSPVFAQAAFAQAVPAVAAPPAAASGEQGDWMQRRLQAAHDRLGITPAQQPQWDSVVATLRDNARAMRASPAVQAIRSGQLNGAQAVRAAADAARVRADAMQRMVPAVEGLYGVLSPEQRQVADREIQHMMHRGPRHG